MGERSIAEARLNEFDKAEMLEAGRLLDPALTEEQFEQDWAEYLALKTSKTLS